MSSEEKARSLAHSALDVWGHEDSPDLETVVANAIRDGAREVHMAQMQEDDELAWSYLCNIACPIMDEDVSHSVANKAAVRIMKVIFGVDMEPMVRERLAGVYE